MHKKDLINSYINIKCFFLSKHVYEKNTIFILFKKLYYQFDFTE